MNTFDAVVYLGLVLAVVAGFHAGFLRSVVTILAYLVAMPIAVWVMTLVSPARPDGFLSPASMQNWAQNSLQLFGIFVVVGIVLGKLIRLAIEDRIGPDAGIGDRLAGAMLGAARAGLVAITMVLIFDLLPSNRQPSFMAGSQLRPLLSAAGQKGFKSLSPEVTATMERLRQERRI